MYSYNENIYLVDKHKVSVGDKQVLCLGPTVPAVPSLSSIKISNTFVTILFGGTLPVTRVSNRYAEVQV